MKSGDVSEREWPFLDGEWPSEKAGHVWLKNMAVFFLMSQGFAAEDIVEERPYDGTHIDVAAELDDGTIVGVECETTEGADLRHNTPIKDGHKIYLLTPDGLYEGMGREGMYLQAVDWQLSLAPTDGQRIGRWFADGRTPKEIPFHRHRRDDIAPFDELRAHDDYDRWVANCKSKRSEQPSRKVVIFGPDG